MATIRRLKMLATRCTVAESPTKSPIGSPVIHLRRRKTLRMLLSSSSASEHRRLDRRDDRENVTDRSPRKITATNGENKKKSSKGKMKLKDLLLVPSPPFESGKIGVDNSGGLLPAPRSVSRGLTVRGGGSLRQMTGAFRYRFMRRAWRPALGTIHE